MIYQWNSGILEYRFNRSAIPAYRQAGAFPACAKPRLAGRRQVKSAFIPSNPKPGHRILGDRIIRALFK
jgi:hypothetical protein